MKSFFEEYSKIIGLLVLAFVIILLFATPSMILAKAVISIDTELSRATGGEMQVRTKLDFGNNEHIQAFPQQIGDWTAYDYNTTGVAETLGADVMLLRAYLHPKLYQPVFFLIMQSNDRSSFHPPIVCYPALGYTIEEEAKAEVPVHNVSWAAGYWRSEREVTFNGTLSVKKLVVVKESKEDGRVTERRVVLYFYVKESPFGLTSNTVTMVRVSALAPTKGSYDGILNITEEFMGDTIPYMFEIREEEPILFTILGSGSLTGKVALVMLFLAPLTIIFYPQIKRNILRRKIP